MNNFIFKSANRLIKNSPITLESLDRRLQFMQTELRANRADNLDIKRMLNKLLIDKHLQMQVDEYFNADPSSDGSATHPEDREDID